MTLLHPIATGRLTEAFSAIGGARAAARRWLAVAAAVAILPSASPGGVVLTAAGKQEGAVSVEAGAIRIGNAAVKWADVLLAVNTQDAKTPPPPDALRLKNGEIWAGKLIKLTGGKVTLETPVFGQREANVADLQAIDFLPGLAEIEDAKAGALHRLRGGPVTGALVGIDADRVTLDTVLGAVTLDQKDLKRYVFGGEPKALGTPERAEAQKLDEITLADCSVLRGRIEPAKDGLLLRHPVLGEKLVAQNAWRSVRRRPATVTYLTDAAPDSVETFPLIRRPAPQPRMESARCSRTAAFVSRIHIYPKTILTYRLPAQPGGKVLFRASVDLAEGSRGSARVRCLLGDKPVFDQVVALGAAAPVALSFEADAGSDLKVEVDFDKNLRFPCSVVMDDAHVIAK